MMLDPIFARTHVKSPVKISGSADVFEAQFAVDVTRDGKVLFTDEIHASAGSGTRGTWDFTFHLDPGKYILVFYEPSAKDGSKTNIVKVPIFVEE